MKKDLYDYIDSITGQLKDTARQIWLKPEKAMEEYFASKLLGEILEQAGFSVTKHVHGIETAFIAEYGNGSPTIGLLAEYDALPGLSQETVPKISPIDGQEYGHGCGHNLLGVGCLGAALAMKELIDKLELEGTLRLYGCPAEETLSGKVLMAEKGLFDDLDACLTWHPSGLNTVWRCQFLAMKSIQFNFEGVPSHAAAAPEMGRSALDGVELMNVGANYLREHIPDAARLSYTIINGGDAPNIVPSAAQSWYYVRAPRQDDVEQIFQRLVKISQGAALMTETSVDHKVITSCREVLPNTILGDLLHENMLEAGSPDFSEIDRTFARELTETLPQEQREKVLTGYFAPRNLVRDIVHDEVSHNHDHMKIMPGSTDAGDVSWITPFAQFTTATWPLGTPAHSWQATAASGSGIGMSAMIYAAKVLAGTLADLLGEKKSLLAESRQEFLKTTNDTSEHDHD